MQSVIYPAWLAIVISIVGLSGETMGQAAGDPISASDPFNGAIFDDERSTDWIGHTVPDLHAIFDGTDTHSIFKDGDPDPAVLTFTRTNSTPISGVNLFTASDTGVESAPRSTSNFTLSADNDNNGSFETVLVPGGNPVDDGRSNFFPFVEIESPSTATTFQATFTPGYVLGGSGPRVLELDAVPVPEPATLALLAIGSLGLFARRRRA